MDSYGVTSSVLLEHLVKQMTGSTSNDLIIYMQRILTTRVAADQEQIPNSILSAQLTRKLKKLVLDKKMGDRSVDLTKRILASNLSNPSAIVRLLIALHGEGSRTSSAIASSAATRSKETILKSMILPRKIENMSSEKTFLSKKSTDAPSSYSREEESKLIRDVLYAFQGVDGHFVRYDENRFVLSPSACRDVGTRNLVLKLCELGYLYKQLQSKISSEQDVDGLVRQSFFCGLRDELSEYFRLIAILESQLDRDADGLTLRQLAVWSEEPLQRLQLMSEMVDATQGLIGGSLASVIHMFSIHGDPFVSDFVDVFLKRVSTPIFESIRLWVLHGELDDVCGEFFVSCDQTVPNERLWFDKYKLRDSMIPSFVGMDLANNIFLVGKSINFIRSCCTGSDWTVKDERQIEASFPDLTGSSTIDVESIGGENSASRTLELLRAIDRASIATNSRLRTILFDQFDLLKHCRALKQYVLLGQGDSIQYLMDLLAASLSQPAATIYKHNIIAQLETAVRGSNSQGCADDILERLDVKLLEASPGDVGWDIFVLDYRLDNPLSCVINSEAMAKYHEIFSFLWKLKRVEYSLSSAWRKEMTTEHVVRDFKYLRSVLHKYHMCRNEMIHFISNLHSYIMFEVLETSWENLVQCLEKAQNLDEIVAAHENYLIRIMDKSLLRTATNVKNNNNSSSSNVGDRLLLRKNLQNLFDLILRFCNVQKRLYTGLLEHVNRFQRSRMDVATRTKNSQWGIDENKGFSGSHLYINSGQGKEDQERMAFEFGKHLDNISSEYRNSLKTLLDHLKLTSSENLRFLSFRLDFNMFYDSLQ